MSDTMRIGGSHFAPQIQNTKADKPATTTATAGSSQDTLESSAQAPGFCSKAFNGLINVVTFPVKVLQSLVCNIIYVLSCCKLCKGEPQKIQPQDVEKALTELNTALKEDEDIEEAALGKIWAKAAGENPGLAGLVINAFVDQERSAQLGDKQKQTPEARAVWDKANRAQRYEYFRAQLDAGNFDLLTDAIAFAKNWAKPVEQATS